MVAVSAQSRYTRAEVREVVRWIPRMLAGRADDRWGLAAGVKARIALALLTRIKLAFEVKSRGGTDESGDSWPPLTQGYLAYGRPVGGGYKIRRGSGGRTRGSEAGGYAPGTRKDGTHADGFMSKDDLARWRRVYGRVLAQEARTGVIDAAAKGKAASIAWADAKGHGVKTKWDVFGNRQVDILRDRGILYRSLSPGYVQESGSTATYTAPSGDQVYRNEPGEVTVGTNVRYAVFHHFAKNPRALRRLWPTPNRIPGSWWRAMLSQALQGVLQVVHVLEGQTP